MNLLTLVAAAAILSNVSGGSNTRINAAIEYTSVDRSGTVTTVRVASGDPYYGSDYYYVNDRHFYRYPPPRYVVVYEPQPVYYDNVCYRRDYEYERWHHAQLLREREWQRYQRDREKRYAKYLKAQDKYYARQMIARDRELEWQRYEARRDYRPNYVYVSSRSPRQSVYVALEGKGAVSANPPQRYFEPPYDSRVYVNSQSSKGRQYDDRRIQQDRARREAEVRRENDRRRIVEANIDRRAASSKAQANKKRQEAQRQQNRRNEQIRSEARRAAERQSAGKGRSSGKGKGKSDRPEAFNRSQDQRMTRGSQSSKGRPEQRVDRRPQQGSREMRGRNESGKGQAQERRSQGQSDVRVRGGREQSQNRQSGGERRSQNQGKSGGGKGRGGKG